MFAPGPRAVGFTIVWPEGVIFSSMMTYHVQFLLLVLAGWVNRQQQDVIDYLQDALLHDSDNPKRISKLRFWGKNVESMESVSYQHSCNNAPLASSPSCSRASR